MRQMGPMIQQMQQTCPDCNGEGEMIKEKDRCVECKGRKIATERKVWLDVKSLFQDKNLQLLTRLLDVFCRFLRYLWKRACRMDKK